MRDGEPQGSCLARLFCRQERPTESLRAEARKENEGFGLGLWKLKGHSRENMQKTGGYVGLGEEKEKRAVAPSARSGMPVICRKKTKEVFSTSPDI